jgi:predicted enzyme related to lactoylglutathione lyase
MQVKKLRQVYIVGSDLNAQVRFYQETLGLPLQFRDGDRWVQFQAGETSLALASAAEGQGAPTGVPVPVFEVTDLDQARGELIAAGATIAPTRDMGAHGRTLMVTDPAGVRLMLFQRATT